MTNRLLFFLDSLPIGGAERHALSLSSALEKQGFETNLLVYSGIKSDRYATTDVPENVTILGRGSNNTDFVGWKMAGEAISKSNADIVIAVNQATLAVAVITRILGLHNAHVICSFHSTIISTLRGQLRLPLFYALLRAADAIIYVSRNQQTYWQKRGLRSKQTFCVVNGVDSTHFSPPSPSIRDKARLSLGFSPSDFVVGLTAQFRPEKNHTQLVEAGARLLAKGVPLKLLFVGDGPCREGVERAVHQHRMDEYVRFVGEHRDVRPFMYAMDTAVLTSTSIETLSLAALEAMATGLPLVLSDIGGASEIVDEGVNGYLYPPGDTKLLANRLHECSLRSDIERMRHAARLRARSLFSFDNMVNQYAEILTTFSRRRSSP